MAKETVLVLDATNLMYRRFMMNDPSEDEIFVSGKIHIQFLESLYKIYRKFKPTKTIICFDRESWRVEYTKSDVAVTDKVYKGHRRQDMTEEEKERHAKFKNSVLEFENILREHSSIICISDDDLEADDIIGGIVYCFDESNIIIISSDKDFMQLLVRDNIKLIDPISGKERRKELKEKYDNNADLFLFEKCIRGDRSDNIRSALPNVRSTTIKDAFHDDYKRNAMMQRSWTIAGDTYKVGDLFKENEILMDLRQQPEHIRFNILSAIEKGLSKQGKYSHFHVLRFLGKYGMGALADKIDPFIPMLSSKNQ